MNAHILLQARISSSRLPAKVLLPISGMPVFELAARRLGNRGMGVTVCTSNESSDDALCHEAGVRALTVFRGALNDVLGRFAAACAGMDDDTVIVRATADNVFPDGGFVETLLSEFETRRCGYLYANGAKSDLPDGLKVELFFHRDLRAADAAATAPYDREHVTPWIIRKLGSTHSTHWRGRGYGALRATIDTLEDYLRVSRVFRKVDREAALTVDHQTLCRYLAELG